MGVVSFGSSQALPVPHGLLEQHTKVQDKERQGLCSLVL